MKGAYKVPECECPVCGYVMDMATGVNNTGGPVEGDISICMKCSTLLVFQEDLSILPASKEIMQEVKETDPEGWNRLQKLIEIVISSKND